MQPNEVPKQSTVRSRGVVIVEQNREVRLEQGMAHNATGDRVVHTRLKEAVFSVPSDTIVQIEARQPDGHKNVTVIEKDNVAGVDRVSYSVLPEAIDDISRNFIAASGRVADIGDTSAFRKDQTKLPIEQNPKLVDVPIDRALTRVVQGLEV